MVQSNEFRIFTELISLTAGGASRYLKEMLSIMKENIKPGKEAELRLKLYTTLAELLLASATHRDNARYIDEYVNELVIDVILAGCKWRAGRSEEAVRTMATSALWALATNQHIAVNKLVNLLDDVLKRATELLEDNSEKTRAITCKLIKHLLSHTGESWPIDCYHTLYLPLVKRIDDRSGAVRQLAIRCLLEWSARLTSGSYRYRDQYDTAFYGEHLRALYQGLLLYLDDPDADVRENVLEVLKVCGQLLPEALLEEVEAVKGKHRELGYCERLVSHVQSLTIQSK